MGIKMVRVGNVNGSFPPRIMKFRSSETGELISYSPVKYLDWMNVNCLLDTSYLLDTSHDLVIGYSNCSQPLEKVHGITDRGWVFIKLHYKCLNWIVPHMNNLYMYVLGSSSDILDVGILMNIYMVCARNMCIVCIFILETLYLCTYIYVNVTSVIVRLLGLIHKLF